MSEKESKPISLAIKLAEIGEKVGAVKKGGTNQQQKYAFIEYAEVAARIRKLLAEYKVAIVPEVESYTASEVMNKYGGKGFHYVLNMTFEIINGDDNEDRISKKWVGEAIDYGDKGVNKAITAGSKYFLMRLFNVSEKGAEDPDLITPEEMVDVKASKMMNEVSQVDISKAKIAIGMATTMEELKEAYQGLGELAKHPEIIKTTNLMKTKLAEKGE